MRRAVAVTAVTISLAFCVSVRAETVTACAANGFCYCVSKDLREAVERNVVRIKERLAKERALGKAIGYLSIPLSTVGGSYMGVNTKVAELATKGIEERFGPGSVWMLNPGSKDFALPDAARGTEYMLMWTKVLEGESGLGQDFDFVYFSGPSDFARFFSLRGRSDMRKIEEYYDRHAKSDPELGKINKAIGASECRMENMMAGSSKAFRKHGTYIYEVPATIARYGTTALAVEALKEAQMSHAWVRIHAQSAYPASEKKNIAAFIGELKQADIAVAGWGWCQGSDPTADAKLAIKELKSFGLSDYVADIEHGVHGANWQVDEITDFCKRVRAGVGGSFGITTFPLIDWHEPELMTAALSFVDVFNPQVYWHTFPTKKMVRQFKRGDGTAYRQNEAFEYVDLCLDRWMKLMGDTPKDIVVTGQAYWGEGVPPFSQQAAEDKLDEFLGGWTGYGRIIGMNWWHFGGGRSMSHRMRNSINKAELGDKHYR